MYVRILYNDEIRNVFYYTLKLSIFRDVRLHCVHMSVNDLFNGRTCVQFLSCPKYISLDEQCSCTRSGISLCPIWLGVHL